MDVNAHILRDIPAALTFYESALAVTREIGDQWDEAATLVNMGIAQLALNDIGAAIAFYELALPIAREIGDRRGEGAALWNIAHALDVGGERLEATVFAEQALLIYQAIDNPFAEKVRAKLAQWRAEAKTSENE